MELLGSHPKDRGSSPWGMGSCEGRGYSDLLPRREQRAGEGNGGEGLL